MIFVYDDIQWAEYGYEAVAGMNAGDGVNYITIPGSETSSILNITETSNVGVPGVWIFNFNIDGGTTLLYSCICAYAYCYIHTYIHMYMHTCIHSYLHTHVHIHKHTYTYIHTYIHTHIAMCMHTILKVALHITT